MRNKKTRLRKLSPLATLPIILGICFFLWHNLIPKQPHLYVNDRNGVWDLREYNLSDTNISLNGSVEYIPNALLTPEEFSAQESKAVIGEMPMVEPYGTSRIRILVPTNGWYTLTRTSIDFSQHTYINGALISEVGMPGTSQETDIPNTMGLTFTVQAVAREIEIVQQSSNFVHRDGGYLRDWTIGASQLGRSVMAEDITASMEMGIYLALFLIHLLLFFTMGGYRPNLCFAAFCLMWFLRTGVIGSKLFSTLLPWLSWHAKFRMEYISLPVAAALTIALIHSLFPNILHKIIVRIVSIVAAAFALLFLFADTLLMSRFMPAFQVFCGAAILYILLCFSLKLRKVNIEQGIFLAGMVLFLYAAIRDFLFYNHIRTIPPFYDVDVTQVAVLAFAFFEATALFIATMKETEIAKQREQQLGLENAALDQMNHLKTEIMATISHEARTPLAVLSSYAGLVAMELRDKGVDRQIAADLDKIVFEAKRVAELIDSMKRLTLHSEERLQRIQLDFGELVRQTTKLYQHILERNGTALILQIEPSLPPIIGSPEELTQVLLNLLQNAKNHTHQGSVTVTLAYDNQMITTTIADTGSGISPDLLPQIFQRGVRDGGYGMGIGLSVCEKIITAHGGTITIESEETKGTQVLFTLPVYREGEQNGA